MTELKTELEYILENRVLFPVFQPIVSLNQKKIIGYEALIRGPENTAFHKPLDLFAAAERLNIQTQLEYICRKVTIKRFAELAVPGKLFLNVSPSVLLEPEFKKGETLKFLAKVNLDPDTIVIELTEHKPTDDYQALREALIHYRAMGFEIALDDLGAGYSGLRLWSELHPEYVKIDKHFIKGLHDDKVKFNFVRSIQNMAEAMNCRVIAEGIETLEDFQIVENIGITHAQGYYFARPASQPVLELDTELFIKRSARQQDYQIAGSKLAGSICKTVSPVSAETSINTVMELFQRNHDLSILPLVDQGLASGLVFREKFLSKLFSSRYGLELYGKQAVKTFVSDTPFSVDKNTSIESVSKQLTTSMSGDKAFVITDNGHYFGVATVLDLLEEMTRQQIQNAQHANPLTLLAGSVPMNNHINRLIAERHPFCVGYFDLDNFKPFNDVYGYHAGDEIIKAVANTLSQHIPAELGMVGHIGGDDFIVIFSCADWFKRCEDILATFKHIVPNFYSAQDAKASGLISEDRHGRKSFFPLLSLSVGLVDSESTSQCQSHVNIADLASEAKKQAKKLTGNSVYINRRAALNQTFKPGRANAFPLNFDTSQLETS
ncbi:MAG: EAL and GGDEF domain-containing protein [Methylococcaceae bacterium]|nr:EAL and GGDEF domain-containing protein [Methylococcaceae bacterium]